ncbi:MAG: hypothetical protein ACR2QK_22700, partial [Acidimicrobiales bacterium]
MTIISDPDFEVDGPDEDPTVLVSKDDPTAADDAVDESDDRTEDEPADEVELELVEDDDVEDDFDDASAAELDDADLEYEEHADEDFDEAAEADEIAESAAADAEPEEGAVAEAESQVIQPERPDESEQPDAPEQPDEPEPAAAAAVSPAGPAGGSPLWSLRQLAAVMQRVLAVFVVFGLVGYGLGALRGSSHVARTEFVYTLDESVPDSFLREDRRLLTQVVTFESDAVLTPVANEFDLTVDQMRAKIDVETLNLSEVLRLDVSDRDPNRAIAISRAVLDRYLQVITDAAPAGDNEELALRRIEVTDQLAAADATRRALLTDQQRDVALELQQESIQRQIDLKNEQINRIQGSLDDSLVQT